MKESLRSLQMWFEDVSEYNSTVCIYVHSICKTYQSSVAGVLNAQTQKHHPYPYAQMISNLYTIMIASALPVVFYYHNIPITRPLIKQI